ncbi:MAG: hypothetical protein ACK4VK_08080 [Aquificaceae bacterium]
MEIKYKDFHRRLMPFKEESLEDLLQEQVNQWIKLNRPKIINIETLWERSSHTTVGVRIWYIQE